MNRMFYTRWFMYAGLFLIIYLFILLIARIQRLRIESRQKTEKKIAELQLAIVRNQMDPHFTMNAINAVIDAVNREEKEQARDNLLHFSKMYRSLVLSADKIKRSLREEIEFTENYLALERFRFRERFRYVIDNGIGRAASAATGTGSTGKGMEMMDQFFELYYQITGVKVRLRVDDLKDERGNPAGTKVITQILAY